MEHTDLTKREICRQVGITWRTLDHWINRWAQQPTAGGWLNLYGRVDCSIQNSPRSSVAIAGIVRGYIRLPDDPGVLYRDTALIG